MPKLWNGFLQRMRRTYDLRRPGGRRFNLPGREPLVYHFAPHPTFGTACTQLRTRIGNRELQAITSTHVLSEAAHHLMTVEASTLFGWTSKVVQRLKKQPA